MGDWLLSSDQLGELEIKYEKAEVEDNPKLHSGIVLALVLSLE